MQIRTADMGREFLVVLAVLNAGCVAFAPCVRPRDPKNPNDYHVSMCASPEQGGAAGARDMAMSEANKKCASLGKSIDAATMTALMVHYPSRTGDRRPSISAASSVVRKLALATAPCPC
jgi:hypothetical protein